jgi:hypothetical protein
LCVYTVYTVYMTKIQYTIRNIPEPLDQVIRKRAATSGKSFNQTVVDLLSLQTFGSIDPQLDENFDWLFGSMGADPGFDEAIKDQSRIEQDMWPEQFPPRV